MGSLSTAQPTFYKRPNHFFFEECDRDAISNDSDKSYDHLVTEWKEMSESDRRRYVEMAEKDTERWHSETENYVPISCWFPLKKVARGKRSHEAMNTPDLYLPKGPPAFDSCLFHIDELQRRACVEGRGAPRTLEFIPYRRIFIDSIVWSVADLHTKLRYINMRTKEIARFEREIKEYRMTKIVDQVNKGEDSVEAQKDCQ